MTAEIQQKQKEYSRNKSNSSKKKLGQYFTDEPIAKFMSSLIDLKLLKNEVNILDSGAGYGMLTLSTVEYLFDNGINKIDATLFEIDEDIITLLIKALEKTKNKYAKQFKVFNYEVLHQDFVVTRPDLNSSVKYDLSIINPPYFKYSAKNSIYSERTSDLFKGNPNIYASFIAVTLSSLKENGQLVVISPRSFLNGLYFKGFRKFLLKESIFDSIHIFKSRKKVFLESNILQENIIFKLLKSTSIRNKIKISCSNNILDIHNSKLKLYSEKIIIDKTNDEWIIRIPETQIDYEILINADKLPSTFTNEGYVISTGKVVEHRTKPYLTSNHKSNNCTPLIKAHNILIDNIKWDGKNPKDLSFHLTDDGDKHLSTNDTYLILKRFTSKDEDRRLVASVYTPFEDLKYIGFSNKLNYIKRKDSLLSKEEVTGLSVFFNSEFMDTYYRCISGSTQVNATDIRIMKFPKRHQIIEMGKLALEFKKLNYKIIETIYNKTING